MLKKSSSEGIIWVGFCGLHKSSPRIPPREPSQGGQAGLTVTLLQDLLGCGVVVGQGVAGVAVLWASRARSDPHSTWQLWVGAGPSSGHAGQGTRAEGAFLGASVSLKLVSRKGRF